MGSHYCSNNKRSSHTVLGLIVLFLIIAGYLGYFAEANTVSSLGYEMRSYQKNIDLLRNDNQRMRIAIAEKSSFKKISENNSAEKMDLVSVTGQRYLVVSSSSLASR